MNRTHGQNDGTAVDSVSNVTITAAMADHRGSEVSHES